MFVPSLNAELNHHLLLSSGGAVQIGVFDWLTPPEEILRQSLQNPLALLRERERARERESARERERESEAKRDGLQPTYHGIQPRSDVLQPRSHGLQLNRERERVRER